jgi:hypothetical protein
VKFATVVLFLSAAMALIARQTSTGESPKGDAAAKVQVPDAKVTGAATQEVIFFKDKDGLTQETVFAPTKNIHPTADGYTVEAGLNKVTVHLNGPGGTINYYGSTTPKDGLTYSFTSSMIVPTRDDRGSIAGADEKVDQNASAFGNPMFRAVLAKDFNNPTDNPQGFGMAVELPGTAVVGPKSNRNYLNDWGGLRAPFRKPAANKITPPSASSGGLTFDGRAIVDYVPQRQGK